MQGEYATFFDDNNSNNNNNNNNNNNRAGGGGGASTDDATARGASFAPDRRPHEFVQRAGDIVLLPPMWAHSTLSVGDCVAISRVGFNFARSPARTNAEGLFREWPHYAVPTVVAAGESG